MFYDSAADNRGLAIYIVNAGIVVKKWLFENKILPVAADVLPLFTVY